MGLAGNLLGTVLGGASKPVVPPWQNISLPQQQGAAIAANSAALPASESLVSSSNSFSQDQISKMLEQAIPGYNSIVGSASSNIESMLKGEIPTDVSQAVQTSDAAQAIGGGYAGSGAARNLVARDLGLTSLNLTQQGLSSAQSWISSMNNIFAPGQLNVSSMFISPQQMFQDTFQNQEQQWNVDWLKNQVKAMPDPTMEAVGQFVGGIGDAAASYFTGGMLGGGMGGGSGGGSNVTDSNYQFGGPSAMQGAGTI